MRDALVITVVLAASACFVRAASADMLDSTRGEPIREVAHAVEVELEDGVATYTVRRSFLNEGDRADQAYLEIRLPEGAAATGLRIRAKGSWYEGELMERDRARELYEELTGVGPHEPKDPALLEWEHSGELRMHIFPVFAGRTSTVEYTLRAPTEYRDGTYHLAYPEARPTAEFVDPVVTVRPDAPGASVRVDGRRTAAGQPVTLSAAKTANSSADSDATSAEPDCEGLDVRDGASCAGSQIAISTSLGDALVESSVKIRHPNPGNIRPRILAPGGEVFDVTLQNDGQPAVFELDRRLSPDVMTEGTWRLVVSDFVSGNDGTLESWELWLNNGSRNVAAIGDGLPTEIPDADGNPAASRSSSRDIEIAPSFTGNLRARLGRVRASPDTGFARLEAEVAPQLSELPEGANFAFLVDASHSVGKTELQAQLELIRGMLHHVPDAEFTVVAYRRFATHIGGGFAPADEAASVLDRVRQEGFFERRNGSHLDRAMIVGTQKLIDREGPKYLVALTDHMLRRGWTNDLARRATRALPDSAVVHVVEPRPFSTGRPRFERTDDDSLADIALDRGGIMGEFQCAPSEDADARNRAALHLVRPVRIENVEFHSIDLQSPPTELSEGEGLREMFSTPSPPGTVTVTGSIWADSFRQTVHVARPFSRATAGYVFSHEMHDQLDDDEMERVARFGRAVSPVTSYLAIEPGVRPSDIGIDRGAMGLGGVGGGGGGGAGFGAAAAEVSYFDVADYLRPKLEACLEDHEPGDDWSAEVTVETTYREIVDVQVASEGPDAPQLEQCVTETAWAEDLPPDESYRDRDKYRVTFR